VRFVTVVRKEGDELAYRAGCTRLQPPFRRSRFAVFSISWVSSASESVATIVVRVILDVDQCLASDSGSTMTLTSSSPYSYSQSRVLNQPASGALPSPNVGSGCRRRPQPSVLSSSNPDPSKSAISEYESPSVENLMVKSAHALHSIGVFLVPIPVVLWQCSVSYR